MSRRSFWTLAATLGLYSLYWLYLLTISPLIDPAPHGRTADPFRPMAAPPPPAEAVRMADRHLRGEPWASRAQYQLHGEQVFLYTQDWNHLESSRSVRLTPLALIWRQSEENSKQPLTVSSESARVQFASHFSITDPNPGRVVGATLEQEVRIAGPNGLLIEGRNFVFSEEAMQIWSDYPVSFQYGPHRGEARGVQIELIPTEQAAGDGQLAVAGVRSIRLRRNVTMSLIMDAEESGEAGEPTPVHIRSVGSFDFQMKSHIATFRDNVQVSRPTGSGELDSLKCDRLRLLFERLPSSSPTGEPEGTNGVLNGRLAFRRLQAEGDNMILVSEENDLTASMRELVYNGETQVAVLIDENDVEVRQQSARLQCPEITLVHEDDGTIASVWGRGAGWVRYRQPDTGTLQFAAEWSRELRKYRDGKTGLQVVELDGQALVRQPPEKRGLAGEFIKVWFQRLSEGREQNSPEDHSGQIRPERLLAVNDVAVVSPEIEGETDRLEVAFDHKHHPSSQQPSAKPVSLETSETPSAGNNEDSSEGDQATTSTAPSAASKTGQPLKVLSDRIRVRVLGNPADGASRPAEIWTEGNVRITQQRTDKAALRLRGDRLHLQNRSRDDQVLHLYGKPAHVHQHAMHIQGRKLHLNRRRNMVWGTGTGRLELPVKRTFDGRSLESPQRLRIDWHEEMTFDGKSVEFYGEVRSRLSENRLRCEQMQVTLNNRISLAGDSASRDELAVAKILCKEGVELDSYRYAEGELVGIRRAHFWQFWLDQQTGDTRADGPGWITVWRRGRGQRAALSPSARVQANKPLQSDSTDWEYLRVDFAGPSEGNLKDRFTTFHDRVKIVYGPVERPLATLDPDHLPPDGGWMRCDQLRFMQHQSEETNRRFIELLARGNAKLEGRTFHARADMISYNESKGLYIVRSLGDRKATIWRQKRPGEEPSRADAQSMKFIPAKNQLKLDRATGLKGLE